MPYRTEWESPTSAYTRFTGKVTYAETVEATEAFYNDPRSDEVDRVYWDFSDIDGFAVSADSVQEMAGSDTAASRYLGPMKAAFVIRDRDLIALAEQYIALMRELGSPWQNRIFQSLDEARRWAEPAR